MDPEEKESICVCWAREGRVFTPKEEEILKKIRELKKEYDHLKGFLNSAKEEERKDLEKRLSELRELREKLEVERILAAKERMKLLGHE